MSQLTDPEIIAALHQAVPEPPHAPGRLADVHRRARHRRHLQISAGAAVTVVVVAAGATVAGNGWPGSRSGQQAATLTPAHTLTELHQRPMHLPTVAAGTPCPISASHSYPAGAGFSDSYTAVGDGPFTMTGNGMVQVNFSHPTNDAYTGTGWPGMKVIWRVSQDYQGPVLLRGAKVDGAGALRFDHYLGAVGGDGQPDSTAFADVAYDTSGAARVVYTYPGAVRVQSAGCYAVQVDGTNFSDIIVFAVKAVG
jgi:hypothetical protein